MVVPLPLALATGEPGKPKHMGLFSDLNKFFKMLDRLKRKKMEVIGMANNNKVGHNVFIYNNYINNSKFEK